MSHVKPVREALGERRAGDVTAKVVDGFIQARLADGYKPGSVNRELGIVSSTLRLAKERKLIVDVPKVRRLKEDNVRRGWFTKAEIEAVIAALPEHLKDFVRFGYLSAWRFGEITGLLWSDVDLPSKTIRLRESKNGEGRLLALEGDLLALIERRYQARLFTRVTGRPFVADLVFHRGGKRLVRIDSSWETACRKAGLAGRHFHDLRRSAVRNMIRAGVPEGVVMKVGGWKGRAMLERYNIVSETDLRQAAQRTQLYVDTLPG